MPTVQDNTYTQVPTIALLDPRLSLKAKGLLAVMLSTPEGPSHILKHIATLSTDGRESTRSAVRDLESRGYVTRTRSRANDGRMAGTGYRVVGLVNDNPSDKLCDHCQPVRMSPQPYRIREV